MELDLNHLKTEKNTLAVLKFLKKKVEGGVNIGTADM